MLAYTIHLLFLSYTALLFARVVGSWIPRIASMRFFRFIAHYTDPYLGLFRRIIPPIGGALDLSPLLGFLALQFMEFFILSFLR